MIATATSSRDLWQQRGVPRLEFALLFVCLCLWLSSTRLALATVSSHARVFFSRFSTQHGCVRATGRVKEVGWNIEALQCVGWNVGLSRLMRGAPAQHRGLTWDDDDGDGDDDGITMVKSWRTSTIGYWMARILQQEECQDMHRHRHSTFLARS